MSDSVPIIGQPTVSANNVVEIKLALVRIEERTNAAAEHRHADMRQAMEHYVPRRELDQTFAGIGVRITSMESQLDDKAGLATVEGLEKRIAKIETHQECVIWAILGTVGMAIASLFGVTIRH